MTKKSLTKKQTGGVSPKKNLSGELKPIAGRANKLNNMGLEANKQLRDLKSKRVVFTKAGKSSVSTPSTEGFKLRTQARPGHSIRNSKQVLKKK